MKTTLETHCRPGAIRALILRFAAGHKEHTFCPSVVARALADDWRPLMPLVRNEAARLVSQGLLLCTQHGQKADPLDAVGPIRLASPPEPSSSKK